MPSRRRSDQIPVATSWICAGVRPERSSYQRTYERRSSLVMVVSGAAVRMSASRSSSDLMRHHGGNSRYPNRHEQEIADERYDLIPGVHP